MTEQCETLMCFIDKNSDGLAIFFLILAFIIAQAFSESRKRGGK